MVKHVHSKFCGIGTTICTSWSNIFWCIFNRRGSNNAGSSNWSCYIGRPNDGPVSQLANTLSRLNGALTAYRNLSKLIGKDFGSASDLSPISRPRFEGEIEFKNVTYKFEGSKQATINDVSFKIPAGQKVALVGKMGSGKSTMSKLIAGILEPTSGAILIDGVDVRQIDPADTRKNIGVMLQDIGFFLGQFEKIFKWVIMNMKMNMF